MLNTCGVAELDDSQVMFVTAEPFLTISKTNGVGEFLNQVPTTLRVIEPAKFAPV